MYYKIKYCEYIDKQLIESTATINSHLIDHVNFLDRENFLGCKVVVHMLSGEEFNMVDNEETKLFLHNCLGLD